MTSFDPEELKRQLEADLAAVDRVVAAAKRYNRDVPATVSDALEMRETPRKTDADDGAGRGEILSALRESLKHLDNTFTWKDALGFLKSRDPGIDYKDTSVRQAVTRLVEAGEVTVAILGRGRRLSVYKRKE